MGEDEDRYLEGLKGRSVVVASSVLTLYADHFSIHFRGQCSCSSIFSSKPTSHVLMLRHSMVFISTRS